MAGHCGQKQAALRLKLGGRQRANGLHARQDSAAGRGYFRIACAGQPHLIINQAGPPEDEVGVAIDESGHDHAPVCVDLARALGCRQFLDAALWAGIQDRAIFNQHCAFEDQAGIAQSRTTARSTIPAQR